MKTSTGDVAAPAEDLQITEVEVDKIRTRIRLRKPKEEKIEELAESIKLTDGLINIEK